MVSTVMVMMIPEGLKSLKFVRLLMVKDYSFLIFTKYDQILMILNPARDLPTMNTIVVASVNTSPTVIIS